MKKAGFQDPDRIRTMDGFDHRAGPGHGDGRRRISHQPESGRAARSPCAKSPRAASCPGSCSPSRPSARRRTTFKTLIFDEIDAGIGGKTAEFIAQKLRNLARTHQIICITHLPQIASFAAHHFRIEKTIENNRTFTTVKKLDFEERVEEIARLMSGSRVTSAALESAREMLRHNAVEDDGLTASEPAEGERDDVKKSEKAAALFKRDSAVRRLCSRRSARISDSTGIHRSKLSQAFGGGMAHLGEACGAVTGAFMLIGLKYGRTKADDLEASDRTYAKMRQFADRFKALHCSHPMPLPSRPGSRNGRGHAARPGKKSLPDPLRPITSENAAEIVEEIL